MPVKENKKFFQKEQMSAQKTIAYKSIYPDGVCRVNDSLYTKTVRFYDINYQLAGSDDKDMLFKSYCNFLNYFDKSISIQFSFYNRREKTIGFENASYLQPRGDGADKIREEYSGLLENGLMSGNNEIDKSKYITFGVEAASLKEARQKLRGIEIDIINNFRQMGVRTQTLNGIERLKLLNKCFNKSGRDFKFTWDLIHKTGLSSKDFIAPSSFDFSAPGFFKMGREMGAVSFLQILAPELEDDILKNFLDIQNDIAVNIHVRSIDQSEAVKLIKRKITDIDRMKIDEQQKARRAGYDTDIIPVDIDIFGVDAKKLLENLQERNERLFLVTILVMNTAENRKMLQSSIYEAQSAARQRNCNLVRLDYCQEAGLMASVPIGINGIEIERALTTSATAVFVPFTTEELFSESKEALYCGLNALSGNLIMADRKQLKNPNGLILGTPGSGKSFAAKREIVSVFLITDDDIFICDAESEYCALTKALGGQVIKLSPSSHDYINPMDINLNYSGGENSAMLKNDFILSFCEIISGEKGLEPVHKTVIDRSTAKVYKKYFENSVPENIPILGDLYEEIRKQPENEAKNIAAALELYVKGSFNFFNHPTNIDISNRIVCFDISELGGQLKKLGMLLIEDQIWNRVTLNKTAGKATRYYCDEFHLLLAEKQTAAYSAEIWKRFRKWGGIPTGITQNCKDLLMSPEAENIFENSDYICMFNQAAGDREILAKRLGISPRQLSYITQSGAGEGLMFYGNTIIPFADSFPKDTLLYRLLTTKPDEVLKRHGITEN